MSNENNLVIRWAAVTHPVSKSLLKYSTVNPINGDWPVFELRLHDIVTDVDRLSTIFGFVGGWGNVAGSGVLWNMMLGFFGSSTDKLADHDVSPLSELAVHVYSAVSFGTKSRKKSIIY